MSSEITRAADYGMRAVLFLAQHPERGSILIGEIAEVMDVPSQFLHKVMPRLVKAGLLSSRRGARGGYRLARNPTDVTLLEVIEAIDGPLVLNRCLLNASDCDRSGHCAVQEACAAAQQALRSKLASFTIEDIARRQNELENDRTQPNGVIPMKQ